MIHIPSRIKRLLDRDPGLAGPVQTSLASFDFVYNTSQTPLFPDFTDHSSKHVSEVLETADALITDGSEDLLTAQDACVLALSVTLHDCGMHLTEDGFLHLLETHDVLLPEFDSSSWADLWADFIAVAKRFDGKTLKRLFGDTSPIHDPALDKEQMSLRDRKLIGEFVRRNHPRLAHEVAVAGFPGSGGKRISLASELTPGTCALSGLVARSHGQELRSVLPHLRRHFDIRNFQGIHAVYLMCVLRIADYLQVHAERAPQKALWLKSIKSPFSMGEWRVHHAIANITTENEDPEAIFIDARPADSDTFLKIRKLLRGIQGELDHCWAVMGEVYGRYKLSELKLEIRRVKSNLDDLVAFAKTVDYLPKAAHFEAADAELLQLLAQPLYGDNPTYGVRELLQNAVDACLERADLGLQPDVQPGIADVLLSINGSGKDDWILTVSDTGIGMTAEVVTDFFLRAGASYRRAEEWKIAHEEHGHSRILRSGRFGIGVIAAFILGHEISVTTRHARQRYGLRFSATLDSENIELKRVDAQIGTSIDIRLHPSAAKSLAEALLKAQESREKLPPEHRDYRYVSGGVLPDGVYLLTNPSLKVEINSSEVPQGKRWPACLQRPLPQGWHAIYPSGFREVQWKYMDPTEGGMFWACNGLAIVDLGASRRALMGKFYDDEGFVSSAPSLSIFDPDGNLPLKLTRTDLISDTLPFQEELLIDIYRDIIASSLMQTWKGGSNDATPKGLGESSHPALRFNRRNRNAYFCTQQGFTFNDPFILSQLSPSAVGVFHFARPMLVPPSEDLGSAAVISIDSGHPNLNQVDDLPRIALRSMVSGDDYWDFVPSGIRLVVTEALWSRWQTRLSQLYLAALKLEDEFDGWVVVSSGKYSQPIYPLPSLLRTLGSDARSVYAVAFTEYHLDEAISVPATKLSHLVFTELEQWLIPYSMEERRGQLSNTFERMAEYTRHHSSNSAIERALFGQKNGAA